MANSSESPEEIEKIIENALFNEMISVRQLLTLVEADPQKVVLLDVRTETEQAEGVIPTAQLFPCDHNLENRQDTGPFTTSFGQRFNRDHFDEEIRYVLICRSGPRTEIALPAFLDNGLLACELIGGVEEWKRQQYPLTNAQDAKRIA